MKKTVIAAALSCMGATHVIAYDLVVSAASQNQVISGSKTYTLPKGTQSVVLRYNVYSAEYPYYVTTQSIYNDVWSLAVTGTSGVLFDITRQVNSQLTQAPTWLADSTTGEITETVNVSSLTASGDATLQLVATSMNVGDSQLTTIVSASLDDPPKLTITSATPDTINTTNAGNYYSVPNTGDTNTLQRYFTLDISKSDDVTVKQVTVTLRGAGDLMQVVQQLPVPSGNDVQVLEESDTSVKLKVRVTVQTPTSSVNASPPPTRDLAYFFEVQGEDADGQQLDADSTISGRRSLWPVAALLPGRYGLRDAGGDAWGARGTYNWLQQHAGLLNEVDDVSGEHGRDVGHASHQYGTDIDTYHFYRFAGGTSGTDNYNRLRNAVVAAFGTLNADGTPNPNPPAAALAARNNLVAFVNATRTGLDNLAALASVTRLYYAIGNAGSGLSNGWARSLILTGRVTMGTRTLDIGSGNWSQAKVNYNSVHNNHVHVTLSRPAIGE
jgi:hypothetical protein